MLAFHSHCQLGNQMFIYACAHSLARVRNVAYCLSDISDLRYFKLSKADYTLNKLKWIWFRIKNFFNKFEFQHLQNNRIDYSVVMKNDTQKHSWYYGYFQGEQYFYNNYTAIKKRFQIRANHVSKFIDIKNSTIGDIDYAIVHIRLNDFKTFGADYLNGPDLSLPFTYYHDLIQTKIPSHCTIVFLSDDIGAVQKEFSYVKNAYFSKNSAITDLQFIINATICILSCSTFSWWGAWLNEIEAKQIYVPKYFLGFKVNQEFPTQIIPKSWNKCDVNKE